MAGVLDGLFCGDRLMHPAKVFISHHGLSPRWLKIKIKRNEKTQHRPIVIYKDDDSDASTTFDADDEMSTDKVDSVVEIDVAKGTVGHPILVN